MTAAMIALTSDESTSHSCKETSTDLILDGVRQRVWVDRYALKDQTGTPIETSPTQMWRRVAKAVAEQEEPAVRATWEQKFFDVLDDFKFVPGGRILAGAGTGTDVTYYNCYVLPSPNDSRGGIMENLTEMIEIMARGGGVGVNLSSLRPKGSYIKSVNGHSSGPVPWMEMYSVATGKVIQQGGTRRGALMLMLDDDHPDIEEFTTRKAAFVTDESGNTRPENLDHANISICISEEFMEAVKANAPWDLVWQGQVVKKIMAADLWDLICRSAWKSADPGLVFMGRVRELANSSYFEDIVATNPCGEQPLGPYSVCLLGAMNVASYVLAANEEFRFNHAALARDVATAVRFLDNVIDLNKYFLPDNERMQKHDIRRMGLGTMGLADTMIKMKVRYGSPEAVRLTGKIFETIRDAAYITSASLAVERGSFGKYSYDYNNRPFIQSLPVEIRDKIYVSGMRNCYLLTNAPTGSTSLIAGVSSGIEPVFDFAMRRMDRTGESFIYHELFGAWREEFRSAKGRYPTDAERPSYFVKAEEVSPEEHINMQAAAQAYVDSSISKTCNVPNNFTVDDVKRLYMYAYDKGCKGITVYRDGSRDAVLHHIKDKVNEDLLTRPAFLRGHTSRIATPVGKALVSLNQDETGAVREVLVTVGKAGTDVGADAEAIGRLISLVLKIPTAVPQSRILEEIVDQLDGIGGASSTGFGSNRVRSLADGIARVIDAYRNDQAEAGAEVPKRRGGTDICPDCGEATFVRSEGCQSCSSCGLSKC